jgi:hypothetical protein
MLSVEVECAYLISVSSSVRQQIVSLRGASLFCSKLCVDTRCIIVLKSLFTTLCVACCILRFYLFKGFPLREVHLCAFVETCIFLMVLFLIWAVRSVGNETKE